MAVRLGRGNPLLRRLRSLRQDAGQRAEENVFVAEGPNLVSAALDAGIPIECGIVDPTLTLHDRGRALSARLESCRAPIYEVAETVMRSLQDARQPQSVLLLVHHTPQQRLPPPGSSTLIAVAHGLQDPGNLGSLVRTAEAAGATAFISAGGGADMLHPRTVRATAGAIFRIPWITVGVGSLCTTLRDQGLRLVEASPRNGEPYTQSDLRGPLAIIFGSEGTGLPDRIRDEMDQTLYVPMRSVVESLSVGAAAAVVLFEAARRRAS